MIQKHNKGPIRAFELDEWRVKHGLSISAACELLGLQRAKWAALQKDRSATIKDNAVCIALELYEQHPEVMPMRRVIDFKQHMIHLGLDPNSPKDRKLFAAVHGRENAASYRLLDGEGGVSKPVERIFEATLRLSVESGVAARKVLEGIARTVAERQGIRDPLTRGSWRKDD